jgi:hypothetical protein
LSPYFKEDIELDEEVINIVDAARSKDHVARLAAHGIDRSAPITCDQPLA